MLTIIGYSEIGFDLLKKSYDNFGSLTIDKFDEKTATFCCRSGFQAMIADYIGVTF